MKIKGYCQTAEILNTFAIFRLILRDKILKYAGVRENALGDNEYKGYEAGINSAMKNPFYFSKQ
ncbi:hypothetical protein AZF37_04960 [endosymbiont 'TC1' of Trimyema compressum]|uniref:hypothetical protein n=1 Tax=endosymbiont 'TC1' of Trimyema compressum TaxID=243899 RepID=UPI0007F058B8|nr:hypothetical protein [endosymbiont 'TC1' of Trimyema compressum]AMP20609.1 hypothetical protein AZF37_04960 [endosymbiont 'TC1' of Trimyema compressum]